MLPQSPSARAETTGRHWHTAALVLSLLAYFLYFSWDFRHGFFASDDMMNLGLTLTRTPAQLFFGQFRFFGTLYRPLGAVFYASIFHFAGLNPEPYHVALSCLLFATACLLYRLTRLLGGSEAAAFAVAVLACYHGGLSDIYFNIDMAFDVLCAFFYFSAFVYYVTNRQKGRTFGIWQLLIFSGLYLAALDSKEMAVTLPVVLLIYEWVLRERPPEKLRLWTRGPGWAVVVAGALNLVYIYARMWGPLALARLGGYRPVFSRHRIVDFQLRSLADLFETWNYLDWQKVVVIWLLLFYLAWRKDRPILKFCFYFLLITPLPIEFLDGRAGGDLYIPFAGWAIFIAVVVTDMAGGVADFLAREPFIGRLGRLRLMTLVVALAIWGWAQHNIYLKNNFVRPEVDQIGAVPKQMLQQLKHLNFHARPNSTLAILHDPFQDYDMQFIFKLWLRDQSVRIWLQRKDPHTPAELARANYVFDYQDGNLLGLR